MFINREKYYPLCFNIPYDDDVKYVNVTHYKYIAKDINGYLYTLGDKKVSYNKLDTTEPQLQMTHFDGCAHYYGELYMPNGTHYELQNIITEKWLEDAHQIRGDWSGYKVGTTTRRFLSKGDLRRAFELLKPLVKIYHD